MSNESRRLVREGFGAIADELRLQRGKLDYIIRLLGGRDAQIQAVREDISQLQESRSEHERKISQLAASVAGR